VGLDLTARIGLAARLLPLRFRVGFASQNRLPHKGPTRGERKQEHAKAGSPGFVETLVGEPAKPDRLSGAVVERDVMGPAASGRKGERISSRPPARGLVNGGFPPIPEHYEPLIRLTGGRKVEDVIFRVNAMPRGFGHRLILPGRPDP